MSYTWTLPIQPSPEIFGLDKNCNITCAQTESLDLLQCLLDMTAGGGAGDAGGR